MEQQLASSQRNKTTQTPPQSSKYGEVVPKSVSYNTKFSDVNLIFKTVVISAHKVYLCNNSKFFDMMFLDQIKWKESNSKNVTIKCDGQYATEESFIIAIECMYTRNIRSIIRHSTGSDLKKWMEEMFGLYEVAQQLMFDVLLELVKEQIANERIDEMFVKKVQFAYQRGDPELLRSVVSHGSQLIRLSDLVKISIDALYEAKEAVKSISSSSNDENDSDLLVQTQWTHEPYTKDESINLISGFVIGTKDIVEFVLNTVPQIHLNNPLLKELHRDERHGTGLTDYGWKLSKDGEMPKYPLFLEGECEEDIQYNHKQQKQNKKIEYIRNFELVDKEDDANIDKLGFYYGLPIKVMKSKKETSIYLSIKLDESQMATTTVNHYVTSKVDSHSKFELVMNCKNYFQHNKNGTLRHHICFSVSIKGKEFGNKSVVTSSSTTINKNEEFLLKNGRESITVSSSEIAITSFTHKGNVMDSEKSFYMLYQTDVARIENSQQRKCSDPVDFKVAKTFKHFCSEFTGNEGISGYIHKGVIEVVTDTYTPLLLSARLDLIRKMEEPQTLSKKQRQH